MVPDCLRLGNWPIINDGQRPGPSISTRSSQFTDYSLKLRVARNFCFSPYLIACIKCAATVRTLHIKLFRGSYERKFLEFYLGTLHIHTLDQSGINPDIQIKTLRLRKEISKSRYKYFVHVDISPKTVS